MRTLITLIFLLMVSLISYAQKDYKRMHSQMLDQAKALMANEEYEPAARIYKRLIPVDTNFVEPYYDMGICLSNLPGQKERAFPFFERAVRGGHVESIIELAHACHGVHHFEQAVALYEQYKRTNYRMVKDVEVDRRIAMSRNANELMTTPVEASIRNMGQLINSAAHDYCPLVTADGNTLYFTSRRAGTVGGTKDGGGQYFEDIYRSTRADEMWTAAVNVKAPLNTLVHDATVGLNPDGSSMIIYRTQPNLVSGDLLETRYTNGIWQTPMPMTDKINSKYHEPSASIAPGGDEIYFTSDRPEGYGGRDLYRIRRLPNGDWSMPLNLGPKVNTPFDEDAPFMHSDGVTLFFSSNGHNTMGGFDIFKTMLIDADLNGWGTPENMGYPVNTVEDDIYFCLDHEGHTGWFSSGRPGGLGMQDIYQVDFPGSQLNYVVVRGVVTDQDDEPLTARLTMVDELGDEIIGVYNTNERTGRFIMVLAPDQKYNLTVEASGYMAFAAEVRANAQAGSREMPLDIQLVQSVQQLSRNE